MSLIYAGLKDEKIYAKETRVLKESDRPNQSHCLGQYQTCHEYLQHCLVVKQHTVA